MQKILAFGAGMVFEKFIDSGDAEAYQLMAVMDNVKQGESRRVPIVKPERLVEYEFDQVVLTLWDEPKVIQSAIQQLKVIGVNSESIKIYSYDRHLLCDVSDTHIHVSRDAETLYAFYDLNSNSETYDITSFLAIADCYREQKQLSSLHLVVVARDEEWKAQAFCLDNEERQWRAQNIIYQATSLLPSCSGMTVCSSRQDAQIYLEQHNHCFPEGYTLDNPPPISVHTDFYYWLEQGIDPRRFKANAKAKHYVSQWLKNYLPQSSKEFICVTLRESSLQPKRNSDLQSWDEFFHWLLQSAPELSVVVIRDTEETFSNNQPFTASNVFEMPSASFHMSLRMALYELAYLNMGCSNGPVQLCHLSQTSAYITCKMIVDDYYGSSRKMFEKRDIEIGKDFRFAGKLQMIDWRSDDINSLISSFNRFRSKKYNPETI